MMRVLLSALLLIAVLVKPVLADESTAKAYAENIGNQALAILTADTSAETKQAELQSLFNETVDTQWIARFVMGRHWKQMSEQQRQAYLDSYRSFLITHYTSNFREYTTGTTFAVTQSKAAKRPGEYQVAMKINRPNAQPILATYRLREKGDSFNIIDIVVEGISLLNTQRQEFSAVIEREGVDHLIRQLQNRAKS